MEVDEMDADADADAEAEVELESEAEAELWLPRQGIERMRKGAMTAMLMLVLVLSCWRLWMLQKRTVAVRMEENAVGILMSESHWFSGQVPSGSHVTTWRL